VHMHARLHTHTVPDTLHHSWLVVLITLFQLLTAEEPQFSLARGVGMRVVFGGNDRECELQCRLATHCQLQCATPWAERGGDQTGATGQPVALSRALRLSPRQKKSSAHSWSSVDYGLQDHVSLLLLLIVLLTPQPSGMSHIQPTHVCQIHSQGSTLAEIR
jgi:hypothetical protein